MQKLWMNKKFILLLLIIFLPACGALSSLPGEESGALSPGMNMPLPDSEKTRLADQAPTFPVPGTELPSPTLEPVETQSTPQPTIPPTQTAVDTLAPSPTFPPTATQQITQTPTLTPSVTSSYTPLPSPTYPSTATITFTTPTITLISTQASLAPFTSTPFPEPTEAGQVPPQTGPDFLGIFRLLFLPGSVCLIGLLILALSIAMFYFQRQNTRPARQGLTLGDLDAGWGDVEVSGKISQIPNRLDARTSFPLDGKNPAPLAVIRLAIEEYDVDSGVWNPLRDDARATQFLLNDGTGMAWIDPHKQDVQLLGHGFIPTLEQVRAALDILDLPPQLVKGERLRYHLWVLRAGERVSVMARVQPRPPVLVKIRDRPLVLSSQNGNSQYRQNEVRSYTSLGVMAAGIGLFGLCVCGTAIAIMLARLW